MTQVKFTSEKWWVLHQESWVEVAEKYWERVKDLIWLENHFGSRIPHYYWLPTPDQIYSLPEEVEFEIRGIKLPSSTIRGQRFIHTEGGEVLKVAHLKDSEPKKIKICDMTHKKYWSEIIDCDCPCHDKGSSMMHFAPCCNHGKKEIRHYIDERSEEVKKEPLLDRISLMLSTITEIVNGSYNKTMSEIYIKIIDLNDELGEHIRLKDSQSEIESLKKELIKLSSHTRFKEMQLRNIIQDQEIKIKELEAPREEDKLIQSISAIAMNCDDDWLEFERWLKSQFTIIKKIKESD